jgi:hypothetical protein
LKYCTIKRGSARANYREMNKGNVINRTPKMHSVQRHLLVIADIAACKLSDPKPVSFVNHQTRSGSLIANSPEKKPQIGKIKQKNIWTPGQISAASTSNATHRMHSSDMGRDGTKESERCNHRKLSRCKERGNKQPSRQNRCNRTQILSLMQLREDKTLNEEM